ncbi:MAG: sulfotransferase [Myxococcales bacterium]|nr:sulfotransferase [Myxococcales bacterium]
MPWTPPERPGWLDRLIAHADAVGGAERLVSLEPGELVDAAIASAGGLDDFGDAHSENWRAWFELLVDSLERESSLHLVGRLLARHDLLRCLRNRLRLSELWKRRPEILTTELLPPSFVIGMPRSGTSILSELLALDPGARTPAMWEMLHPAESLVDEAMRPIGHAETLLMEDLAPEYASMHQNSGDLPNECIFMMANTFVCDLWSGTHVIPSYDQQLARADHRPVYAFHRKLLQTLQQRDSDRCTRWGLKAPSHLPRLGELFSVYPDARILRIHRDPLRSLPSTVSLMGTLKRMRCEQVDLAQAAEQLAAGNASLLQQELEKRADGRLPDAQFIDVRYQDLMQDPPAVIRDIYQRAGWELSGELAARIEAYLEKRPRGARGEHAYTLESLGFDRNRERERFRFYCERYQIQAED